jgi:hypothetical protein
VRLTRTSSTPVEYYWDFGDGTLAEGNNAVHHYRRPGRYRLTVTARNRQGRDADTVYIMVRPRPAVAAADSSAEDPELASADAVRRAVLAEPAAAVPPPAEPAATGLRGGTIRWENGGYTWRVRTYFEAAAAEHEARRYLHDGFRVGILRDASGPGSTAYRVVIGQFPSVAAALRAQAALPHQTGTLLMDLSDVAPPLP